MLDSGGWRTLCSIQQHSSRSHQGGLPYLQWKHGDCRLGFVCPLTPCQTWRVQPWSINLTIGFERNLRLLVNYHKIKLCQYLRLFLLFFNVNFCGADFSAWIIMEERGDKLLQRGMAQPKAIAPPGGNNR